MTQRTVNLRAPNKKATLLFLVKDDQILLAMKKRGFGRGRYNGVGGKVERGESVLSAALRETKEEIGVLPKKVKRVALLDFYFPHNPDWHQRVSVYLCSSWRGNPRESAEMKPKWFDECDLPFKRMWSDDTLWLPHVLHGKKVKAKFIFTKDDKIRDYTVEVK